MFWKTNAALRPAEALVPDELESSLEATAEILRALGRHSFDVGDVPASVTADTFERWATHVLVVARPPGSEAEPGEQVEPPRRDFKQLARFVRAHRKMEREHVVRTTTDMRDAILTFVRCFASASLEQGKTSKTLRERVERLRSSVESNSLEELKASALGVAEAVTHALELQEQRMRDQSRELKGELSKLQEDLEQAKTEGSTDALTLLQNRRAFDMALERSVSMATLFERPLCLMMIDVDHFKSINDRHGHPVGDRVLRALSDALTRSFPRRSDVVARYGGEEFACLLGAELDDAKVLASRLLAAIRKLEIEDGGEHITLTVSLGLGELRRAESGAELVARVDRALYEAKAGGRDRVALA
jgi:diguanylate cyclase